MRIMCDGQEVATITTNKSLHMVEALETIGINVNDPESIETAYRDGFPAAYVDDEGNYSIDFERLSINE